MHHPARRKGSLRSRDAQKLLAAAVADRSDSLETRRRGHESHTAECRRRSNFAEAENVLRLPASSCETHRRSRQTAPPMEKSSERTRSIPAPAEYAAEQSVSPPAIPRVLAA